MIVGHLSQQNFIKNILANYNQGLFLLYGPEAVGKFYLLKILTEKFKPIIFNFEDKILNIKTAEFIQRMLFLTTKEKQIIIVNNAHLFNKEAQNKLLKILEEVNNNTLIFLISHKPFKILSTIHSRAQKIRFSLVDNDEIKNFFQKQNYSLSDINFLLKLFPGQIGKIFFFLNNKEKLKNIQKIITAPNIFDKFQIFYKIEKDFSLEELIKYFIIYEHDNLLRKDKSSLKKIKYLLSLYEDSSYFLNKELQFANIILNIYG